MRRQDSLMLSMSLGVIAFAVAFVYPQFAGAAVPWYYPLERRWAYEVEANGLAMDFYGRLMFAMIAWCVVVIIATVVTRRLNKPLSSRSAGLWAAWACAATLLIAMNFAWTLYFRVPTPEPIPSWYKPR